MIEAVAKAARVPAVEVRRALTLRGWLPAVGAAALGGVSTARLPPGGRPAGVADARPERPLHRDRVRQARGPGRRRVEARRHQGPGTPPTTGVRLHPRPRRHHHAGARAGRGGGRPALQRPGPRRRGHRAPPRRPPRALPGHLRPRVQPHRRCRATGGDPPERLLLRRAAGRRRRPARPAWRGSPRGPGRGRAPGAGDPPPGHRRRRGRRGVLQGRDRAVTRAWWSSHSRRPTPPEDAEPAGSR